MVAPKLPSQGAGLCASVNRESINVGFTTQQLRCCKVSRKLRRRHLAEGKYLNNLKHLRKPFVNHDARKRVLSDGEGYARPCRDDCRSRSSAGDQRCRRAAEDAGAAAQFDACASRSCGSRFGRSRCSGRREPGSRETASHRTRYHLPLRRGSAAGPARRAAVSLLRRGDILPGANDRNFPVADSSKSRPVERMGRVRIVHQLALRHAQRSDSRRAGRR